MLKQRRTHVFILTMFLAAISTAEAADVEKEVLAVADKALELITSEDFHSLSEQMVEEAMNYTVSVKDGQHQLRVRTWAESREITTERDIVERGFDPTVLVSGPLAMVWYPYDLYLNGD